MSDPIIERQSPVFGDRRIRTLIESSQLLEHIELLFPGLARGINSIAIGLVSIM